MSLNVEDLESSKKKDLEVVFELCQEFTVLAQYKLRDLLKKPGNESILFSTNSSGWTPLMIAVFKENEPIVFEIFQTAGASIYSSRLKYSLDHESKSGITLMELARGVKNEKLKKMISGEIERKKRLDDMPKKTGFHETDSKTFEFIKKDALLGRFPMIGGTGGYFGRGIYFAVSEQESTKKAMHHGAGFQCELKMGNCFKITTTEELESFRDVYCKGNSYGTPTDVMRERLLRDDYDSVWGHQDTTIEDVSNRVLLTGDEFVVYSADQVSISHYYSVELENPTFNHNLYPLFSYIKDNQPNIYKWVEYDIAKGLQPIPPTRKARYYKLYPDIHSANKTPLDTPLSIQKMKNLLKSRNPENELQTGDIVDFSVKDEPLKCIKACLYIQYPNYEKWVPVLFGINSPYLYLNMYILDDCKKFTKMNTTKTVLYRHHLENLPFLKSKDEILSHYQNLIQANQLEWMLY
jgi:hypothetical protein